jgi:hypothetical protein
LENAVEVLDPTVFKGIYRDDGFVVFRGELTKSEVTNWLPEFQKKVDELSESNFLRFTVVEWGDEKDDGTTHSNVTVNKSHAFLIWIWRCIGYRKANCISGFI